MLYPRFSTRRVFGALQILLVFVVVPCVSAEPSDATSRRSDRRSVVCRRRDGESRLPRGRPRLALRTGGL